jgi:hypothetical protein
MAYSEAHLVNRLHHSPSSSPCVYCRVTPTNASQTIGLPTPRRLPHRPMLGTVASATLTRHGRIDTGIPDPYRILVTV